MAALFLLIMYLENLDELNLPRIRFHELRHSCASFLINMGFSLKDVQEWLGHADIKMTENIYSHIDVSIKKNMADTLSNGFAEKTWKRVRKEPKYSLLFLRWSTFYQIAICFTMPSPFLS